MNATHAAQVLRHAPPMFAALPEGVATKAAACSLKHHAQRAPVLHVSWLGVAPETQAAAIAKGAQPWGFATGGGIFLL